PGRYRTWSCRQRTVSASGRVAGQTVAEGRTARAQADRESDAYECAGENKSVISHVTLLVMFVLEAFAGHAEVDDREQHEDERLYETDEDDVESFPNRQQDGADHGPACHAHQGQGESAEARKQTNHDRPGKDVSEQPEQRRHGLDKLLEEVERGAQGGAPHRRLERLGKRER